MKILLHSCCGPCASHCLSVLQAAGHEVTLFFSNANIAPSQEFERRLEALYKLADITRTPVIVDPPVHQEWLCRAARGFENEPEKGLRCARCFRYSLCRTAMMREKQGFDTFTTSLTVSPHKHSPTIFNVATSIDASHFLQIDFKKKNGFLHSIQLAKEYGLYRQNYCGCEFSLAALKRHLKEKEELNHV